jgi:hypothetical protein
LESGESAKFEKTFTAEVTANYEFITSAELPDGQPVQSSIRATIEVEEDAGGLQTFQLLIIIVLVAIGAVAVVLAYYLYRQKKRGPRATASRPRPQPYGRPGGYNNSRPPVSASGRERPQRYGAPPEPNGDFPPEHPSATQQKQAQRKRAMRIETLEPKEQPPRPAPAERTVPTVTPKPSPKSGGTKFGDRNKF